MLPLCPACREPLTPRPCARGIAQACARCGGLWIGNDLARAVLTGVDAQPIAIADEVGRAAAVPFPDAATGAPCPECGAPLIATAVPAASLHVDLCAAHGTWFERHELQAVAAAYARERAAAGERALAPPSAPIAPPMTIGQTEPTEAEEAITAFAVDAAIQLAATLLFKLLSSRDDS